MNCLIKADIRSADNSPVLGCMTWRSPSVPVSEEWLHMSYEGLDHIMRRPVGEWLCRDCRRPGCKRFNCESWILTEIVFLFYFCLVSI